MRTGLLAKKVGMSSIYSKDGRSIAVTLLLVEDCQVIAVRSKDRNGYDALQIGFGNIDSKRLNKPQSAMYAKLRYEAKSKIKEFRVTENCAVGVGSKIGVDHFVAGQFVDVVGTSIGKGFAGVMKRWNFRGLEASHGVSITHRSHGSTGQRQDPGRVAKGKKMAGHLGSERVTIQNLRVLKVDSEKGLIIVRGAVPGHKGAYVEIKDAVKKNLSPRAPMPAMLINVEASTSSNVETTSQE